MTYQGPRTYQGAALRPGRTTALAGAALVCVSLGGASVAAEVKRDFRGLENGMTVDQAKAAAATNGMACETGFTSRTTCKGDGASVVLETTGRKTDLIWELQVTLAGHFDAAAMKAELDRFYGLAATSAPHVFATTSGQELMLLEIGETSTIFYLRDPKVLAADPQALPPPKL